MNPSTALATVLVDELLANGVRDAVLSPGSRNAPLAFALHRADAAGRLRLHVRIDERTAGFLALGLAAGSGRPVPVVCTSGTAAANLHPAVLEAHHSGVPLLVLTADRPAELYGTGANQTIEQAGLYGPAVRWLHTVQTPGDNALWRSAVCRAVAAARGTFTTDPGPIHLNIALRPPLVPDPTTAATDPTAAATDPTAAATDLAPAVTTDLPPELAGRPDGTPWTSAPAPRHPAGMAASPADTGAAGAPPGAAPTAPTAASVPAGAAGASADAADAADRPGGAGATGGRSEAGGRVLVVAGNGGEVRLPEWLCAVPRVAEPGSALWAGALRTGPWLLGAGLLGTVLPRPDHVVVVGRPTLHRGVQALLADPEVRVTVLTDRPRWTDVAGHAAAVATTAPPPEDRDLAWEAAVRDADRAAAPAVDGVLDAAPWPSGPAVARDLVAALPDGALLTVGSSNPIRDVSLAAAPRRELRVHANRGVAGIDGTVSTAVGMALSHRGPSFALLGDLTFLHDVTGLVIGPDEPRPGLTVVVFNDDGGGIFSLLEQGGPAHRAAFERIFGTPHGVGLAGLCAATGVRHVAATTAAGLRDAVTSHDDAGITVVEVRADRSGLRELHAAIRAAVTQVIT